MFNFNKYNNVYDPFEDFMTGMRPKRQNPMGIPDDLFDISRNKKSYMGPEMPDKFVNPEGDPKSRAKKDAMLQVGLSLLSNAFTPGSDIGRGIGDAISSYASTYRGSKDKYLEEDRDLEDRALREEIAREQLAQSRVDHARGGERFGREKLGWTREDEARDAIAALTGDLFAPGSDRARLAGATALLSPTAAVSQMDNQLARPERLKDHRDIADINTDVDRENYEFNLGIGREVSERERFTDNRNWLQRNFDQRASENNLNRDLSVYKTFLGDSMEAHNLAYRDAAAATKARLAKQTGLAAFTALDDLEAEKQAGPLWSSVFAEELKTATDRRLASLDAARSETNRAFPGINFPIGLRGLGDPSVNPNGDGSSSRGGGINFPIDLGDASANPNANEPFVRGRGYNVSGGMLPPAAPGPSSIYASVADSLPNSIDSYALPGESLADTERAMSDPHERLVRLYPDVDASREEINRLLSKHWSWDEIEDFYNERRKAFRGADRY